MTEVVATLVVNFGEGAATSGGLLTLEVDDRPEGLNAGETNFEPGDTVGYLMYRSSDVTLKSHVATLGEIKTVGGRTRTVEQAVNFANVRDATLTYPIASNFIYTWVGNLNPGAISQDGDTRLVLPAVGTGRAIVQYTTAFTEFRLTNIPSSVAVLGEEDERTEFAALIVAIGEVPD